MTTWPFAVAEWPYFAFSPPRFPAGLCHLRQHFLVSAGTGSKYALAVGGVVQGWHIGRATGPGLGRGVWVRAGAGAYRDGKCDGGEPEAQEPAEDEETDPAVRIGGVSGLHGCKRCAGAVCKTAAVQRTAVHAKPCDVRAAFRKYHHLPNLL